MEIIVAKSAGFCFGVSKAVGMVYDLLEKTNEKIYTFGPIIHNEQVISELESKGVLITENINTLTKESNIIIRAHGIPKQGYLDMEEKGLKIFDATCPYVKKIHNLVSVKHKEGSIIIIVGDRNHPEVIGINGWCGNKAIIIENYDEVEILKESDQKVCVFAQTTISKEKWEQICNLLKQKYKNLVKFDTICNATNERQSEAEQISKNVDMMIVIGGKNSSNSRKLYEICKKNCEKAIQIETFGELPPVDIKNIKKIGITAGASTPEWIIKEVILKMDELFNQDNEMSFKEALERSFVALNSGEIVKGKIIGYNNSEVFVDLGYKCDGTIPLEQFSDDPDFNPKKELTIGQELEVFVVRVDDKEGNVLLSKKKVDAIKGWSVLEEAFKNKTTLKARVTGVVNGGVVANSNGVRIFVPASQISNRFVKDLNEFNKQNLVVRIIEINKEKRKIVASQRVILEEEREINSKEIWESIEIGKEYKGTVKSLTDFGAFVDIGGVDGLVHLSELSWKKVKHPSEVLKMGDIVEVKILDFDKEKKKISLGYKKTEENPWNNMNEKFKVGDVVPAKVLRLVPFGAFLELEHGIDGLVHISQISEKRISKPDDVLKVGQVVDVKIIELSEETKKISLSIKEVNPSSSNVDAKSEATEETKTEHIEDMKNSIGEVVGNPEDIEE